MLPVVIRKGGNQGLSKFVQPRTMSVIFRAVQVNQWLFCGHQLSRLNVQLSDFVFAAILNTDLKKFLRVPSVLRPLIFFCFRLIFMQPNINLKGYL